VIAKNALGNFQDLLLATAQSPAMMVYLDNWLSIGPDSIANGVILAQISASASAGVIGAVDTGMMYCSGTGEASMERSD